MTTSQSPDSLRVFVGGSGRSGTTVTAELLGTHSQLAGHQQELRVHVQRNGAIDLFNGRVAFHDFADRCTGPWFHRAVHGGVPRVRTEGGLTDWVSAGGLARLLDVLEADIEVDRQDAVRSFLEGLLAAPARAAKKPGWIEHSPDNIVVLSDLHALFPEARFIHCVRDGRDVASSMLQVPWGPADLRSGIRWWASRLRLAWEQAALIPDDRLVVLNLEDLVLDRRQEALSDLFSFLGLAVESNVQQFHARQVTAERAKLGRWRQDVHESEQPDIETLYREVVDSLRDDGVPLPTQAPPPLPSGPAREAGILRQRHYEVSLAHAHASQQAELAQTHLARVSTQVRRLRSTRDLLVDVRSMLLDELTTVRSERDQLRAVLAASAEHRS